MNASTRSLSIYIVDDEPCIRNALERLLRSKGHTVKTFASAEEFLKSNLNGDEACLVLDIHLEGMSGLQLQNHLVKEGILIPTVFISARMDDAIQTQIENSGSFFLRKPFQCEQLIAAIDQAVCNPHLPDIRPKSTV